ncbi:MAG TPA: hypothetical protein PKA27_00695 [Fimbriimonadaceae bacterium]|nr:hypothetical protein [Fimbriimonadaceae bacterium]
MATWKEGDRVRIVTREVTEEDRKTNQYYSHMAGLVGTIQNIYANDEIAVRVDVPSLSAVSRDVHKTSIDRMRDKFVGSLSEEQKKSLSSEELNFDAHYMLLCQGKDLEKA